MYNHTTISTAEVASALDLLGEAEDARAVEFDKYAHDGDVTEIDDETDSNFPVFDAFYDSGGSANIICLTSFIASEFYKFWYYAE